MATKKTEETKATDQKAEAPKPRAPDAPAEKIRHHVDGAPKSMPNAIDAPAPRNGDPLAAQRNRPEAEEKKQDEK